MQIRNVYGIDLGTSTVKIYDLKKDTITKEKNMIAIRNREQVIAVGNYAYEMHERTPSNIEVITPMSNGRIANVLMVEAVLHTLLHRRHRQGAHGLAFEIHYAQQQNTDQAGAKKDGQMLPPDAEHLPVEQAEHHRQHQQSAEVPDKHPVAQRHARAGEQAVRKPDKAPAHGTEDHVDIGNVLFHSPTRFVLFLAPQLDDLVTQQGGVFEFQHTAGLLHLFFQPGDRLHPLPVG